jgi:hypothetical protein
VIDGGLELARIITTASHSLDDDQAALPMVRANHAELLHPASVSIYLDEQLGCSASLRGALKHGTETLSFQKHWFTINAFLKST